MSEIDAETDPYAYVLSANVHRRHLTAEQKRELIAKVLKAQPEKSNRHNREADQGRSQDGRCGAREARGTWGNSPRRDDRGHQGPPAASTQRGAGIKQKADPVKTKTEELELPLNDVEAAENATAQFLYELGDLDEEFDRITDQMVALGERLCASLDIREGETFAEFMHRLDPEHGNKSDKPQVLIAEMACMLLCSSRTTCISRSKCSIRYWRRF